MSAVHREDNETGITPVLLLLDAYLATPDGVAVAEDSVQKQRAVLDPYDNSLVPLPFNGSLAVDPAADAVWLSGAGPLPLCSTRSPGRCAPDNSVTEIRAWATNIVLQVWSYPMPAAIRGDDAACTHFNKLQFSLTGPYARLQRTPFPLHFGDLPCPVQ